MKMQRTAEFLQNNDNFIILTHRRPDGDTCGSASALCIMLRKMGKRAYLWENEDATARLLPFVKDFYPPSGFVPDRVIAVDIADESLLPGSAEGFKGKIDLCIDHHPTNKNYAKITLVESFESAAGVIIYELAEMLGVRADISFADRIYLALATDTGCFRFANTTPKTHRIAALCMEAGADFHKINTDFFIVKTKARMALEKELFDKMVFSTKDDRICASVITRDTVERLNADNDDLDNLSTLTMEIESVLCGILITENKQRGTYKVSARSRPPISASRVCARFGGGGHERAAGASIEGTAEECIARLLKAAEEDLSCITDC